MPDVQGPAWKDCPTCRGKDGKRWGEVDVRERCQACNGQGFTAGVLYGFDEEVRTECPRCHWQGSIIVKTIPCPTCAAHFKAVDEARAVGAREATEALAVERDKYTALVEALEKCEGALCTSQPEVRGDDTVYPLDGNTVYYALNAARDALAALKEVA